MAQFDGQRQIDDDHLLCAERCLNHNAVLRLAARQLLKLAEALRLGCGFYAMHSSEQSRKQRQKWELRELLTLGDIPFRSAVISLRTAANWSCNVRRIAFSASI